LCEKWAESEKPTASAASVSVAPDTARPIAARSRFHILFAELLEQRNALLGRNDGCETHLHGFPAKHPGVLIDQRAELLPRERVVAQHLLHQARHGSRCHALIKAGEQRVGPQVVHFAVGEGERAHAARIRSGEDLTDAATGVVSNQIDAIDLTRVEESGDHSRL